MSERAIVISRLISTWQAIIGANVAGGSLFAMLQGIGMGASVPPVAIVVGGVVIGLVTFASVWALIRFLKKRRAQ